MARNPKLDLAKRQAVGVYRAVPRFSIEAKGDIRPVEGMKPVYHSKVTPAHLEAIATFTGVVTVCKAGLNSSGRVVQCNDLNRRRGGCDPRTRGDLMPGQADRLGTRYYALHGGAARLIPRAEGK